MFCCAVDRIGTLYTLFEGTRVEFDISTNPKTGEPCAVNVRVVQ